MKSQIFLDLAVDLLNGLGHAGCIAGFESPGDLSFQAAPAGQNENEKKKNQKQIPDEPEKGTQGREKDRPDTGDFDLAEPAERIPLELIETEHPFDVIDHALELVPVSRQLNGETFSAGIEHDPEKIEESEGQKKKNDDGQRPGNPAPGQEIQDRRDDERKGTGPGKRGPGRVWRAEGKCRR
jgi:hypothetical protein